MANTTTGGTASATYTENPVWIVTAVGLLGLAAWVNRNEWYASLAPYGLTTEDTRTVSGGYGQVVETAYGTGHFQLNAAGWAAIAIVAVGLVAGLWCVLAGVLVARWWVWHGTGAVPTRPAPFDRRRTLARPLERCKPDL